MLILCGSSMSYMEDHVLAYKAPLYGRRTAQMKLLPFDFEETCRYFKNFTAEDKALIYGVVGGTPQYLLQINDALSVEDNIKDTFLNPVSFLYEEPINLLKQEVREPAIYTAIIAAIATGASRMSEISGKVGEDTNVCAMYLKNLINLGIVQKEHHMAKKLLESRFIRLKIICSAFGIGSCLKIIQLLPAAPQIWHIGVSSRSFRTIWARFLRKSVNSICGNSSFPATVRLSLQPSVAGGAITERKAPGRNRHYGRAGQKHCPFCGM